MSSRPVFHRPAPPPLGILGVAAASLLLAACGGSSSPSSTSAAAKEQRAEVRDADFARCLREHGIEATAVTGPGGKGQGLRIRGAGGPADVEAAQTACKQYQPESEKVKLSPQEQVARTEAVEKFAKCMRAHGVPLHSSSSEGHVSIQIGGSGAGPSPESPAFQKAQQACQGLLPFKAPGRPPPKLPPGGSEADFSPAGG